MAAATALLSIDPTKGAKYPITVSERLLNSGIGTKRNHASIQLNYKPKLSDPKTTTTISKLPSSQAYRLSIKNDDSTSEYKYTGRQKPTDACVLIYNPTAQQMVLDKLDTQFEFNLQSTPTNKDASSLAQKHPHLHPELPNPDLDISGEVAASGDPESDDIGDPTNPYDYRHFLQETPYRRSPSPSPRPHSRSSPAQRPSTTSSPATRPIRPKPRPRPQQKRAASPPPREEADADNEDSSDGELIIEMEPSDTKRRNRFMGAFDRDITSTGPISLRSAASSMSPAARIARGEGGDADVDVDVEELRLPSPRGGPPVRTPQQEAEDEADLEAELEMALEEEQADGEVGGGEVGGEEVGGEEVGVVGGTTGGQHAESSSESEEE